jgi:DNA-binding response OmpR family regulator
MNANEAETPRRILLVDDDKDLLRALATRLRSVGYDVQTCSSAEHASPAAARGRLDLIILDIDMPSFTGPEFHHCLQFSERAKGTPVVYLTGHDTDSNRRMASEQGAAAFLTKPYDPAELVATVQSVISRAKAVRTNGHCPGDAAPEALARPRASCNKPVSCSPS